MPLPTPAHGSAAIRIATGAPLPPGADAVVPVELTTPLGADGEPGGEDADADIGSWNLQ